jgi:peptide-methionine (S)-S-oxide reductase
VSDGTETATLAGGCFWILQQLLRERDGVISTRAGWTGGRNEHPSEYDNDGHAEAVEVVFDPERLSYRELLEYYFQVHRPDLGEDAVGSGYRSEIFCASPAQRAVAAETIADVDASKHWPGPTATRISDRGRFWEAVAEDQDYLQRYPDAPSPFPRRN